jgi:hypothetical protein
MAAIRGPEPDEPGFEATRLTAIGRHNAVLREHAGSPISYGNGIYLLCLCGQFKGTFAGFEDHCREVVVDAAVRR